MQRLWRGILVATLVSLALVGLAGCGGDGSGSGKSGGGTSGGSTAGATPVFAAGDSITVQNGTAFVIELAANPTTGYAWTAAANPNAEYLSSAQVTKSTLPGASGMQRLTFRATAPGSSTLALSYARSFEPDTPPAQTQTFPLTVT